MKKLLLILLLPLVAFAATPTATIVPVQWGVDSVINASGVLDSLEGADTITLVTNWSPDRTWEHILAHDALTNTTDSIGIAWELLSYDGDGNLLYTVTFDSTTAAPGAQYVIPVGQTALGHKFTVQGITYAAHSQSGEVFVNRVYFYKRRGITTQMNRSDGGY